MKAAVIGSAGVEVRPHVWAASWAAATAASTSDEVASG